MNYRLPLMAMSCLGVLPAVSQNDSLSVRMNEVVVTGTGTHHRMSDSPVPVAVIHASDLRKAGVTTLEEALTKLTPAFSFSTNGMGTSMTLNGIGQNYVLILVDGKKMAGDDTYTRINLDRIKRIEVLNGAASALYGSDAIGGVINIITSEPSDVVEASNYIRYSGYERVNEAANLNISKGKWGTYSHYNYQHSGNWQLNPLDEKGLITGKMNSTGYRSHNFDQKLTFKATDRLSFYLRGNYYNYSTQRPDNSLSQNAKDLTKFSPAYTYDISHESYLYGGGAKYRVNERIYLEADAYSDNYTGQKVYMGNEKTHSTGEKSLDKRIHYTNVQAKAIFLLGNHRLSAGAEFLHEALQSEKTSSYAPIDETMYTYALFAQEEWKINPHFYVLGGLRYVYHQNFHNYVTPNISFMYRLNQLNLRASYAGGFRTPELAQLYTQTEANAGRKLILPNTQLRPEKNHYWALNAEYSTSRFSVSLTGYINKLYDMINYYTYTADEKADLGYADYDELRQRRNIDRAKVAGINVMATVIPINDFSLTAGYAWNNTRNEMTGNPLDKSLKHSGTINARWLHRWKLYQLDINLNGRIQSKRYSESYDEAPAYSLWDLNTRHTFKLRHITLEPGLGIENVLDYKDDRPWNNNFATLTPGRTAYISLMVKFL